MLHNDDMQVGDLLDDELLGLVLSGRPTAQSLATTITGFAQSEMIAPGGYISAGEILATHGMGMNVQDVRTWDAYVERLVEVSVSAVVFALGLSHREAPEGLVRACARYDLPLLIAQPETPLVKVSRHIWRGLETERYAVARAGWNLADDCARQAANGGSISDLLARFADAVSGDVELVDATGSMIASARAAVPEPEGASTIGVRLPGEAHSQFTLRVRTVHAAAVLQPMLSPATAVLGMQLSYTLSSASPWHSHTAARFFESLLDGRASAEQHRRFARTAGFSDSDVWDIVMLKRTGEIPHAVLRLATMRLRVQLEQQYECVRFFDELHHVTFLMQRPRGEAHLRSVLAGSSVDAEALDAGYLSQVEFDELAATVSASHRCAVSPGVHRLKTLDLNTLMMAVPSGAARVAARRALHPLLEADMALVPTLSAYLRHSGRSTSVCEELFIHRNTLAYRVRRIEELLEVDLADGTTRAVLLLALEVVGAESVEPG